MKVHKLTIEYDYDFTLLGVVSSVKEYKLAWTLNNWLNIKLVKCQDLSIDIFNQGRLVISNYLYSNEHSSFRLIKNKSWALSGLKKPFLLPDIKEYDYVIQIQGFLYELYQEDIISKISSMNVVQYCKAFDPAELKHRENLLF